MKKEREKEKKEREKRKKNFISKKVNLPIKLLLNIYCNMLKNYALHVYYIIYIYPRI